MGFGLGFKLGLSSYQRRSSGETILPFFNGIPDAVDTYEGGPVSALDVDDVLQAGYLDVPTIEGARLATTEDGGAVVTEKVTNVTFDAGTDGWSEANATLSTSDGKMLVTLTAAFGRGNYSFSTTPGVEYVVTGESFAGSHNPIFRIGSTLGGYDYVNVSGAATIDTSFIATELIAYVSAVVNSSSAGSTALFDNISVTELFPQWLPTDSEGAELYANTLVGDKRLFADENPLEFKRWHSAPAVSNLFVSPTSPANQNIDLASTGTGDYTLSAYGSGSVTVAAGTATGTGFGTASAGTDVTFNISAVGTIALTVTDAPDIVQVEKGLFATPPVDGVRQTTKLTATTASYLQTNNMGGRIQAIPDGAGQTAWLWYSYVDADNGAGVMFEADKITFRKRVSGVNTDCSVSYSHAADTPVLIDWYTTSASGMGVRYAAWTGAAWSAFSAWTEVTTAAGKANMQLASTFERCSANGSEVFSGNLQLDRPFARADIKSYLEAL